MMLDSKQLFRRQGSSRVSYASPFVLGEKRGHWLRGIASVNQMPFFAPRIPVCSAAQPLAWGSFR